MKSANLRSRFAKVVQNFKQLLLLWQRHLTLFTTAYDNAADLVPYFVLAGAYFSGRFGLGEFTQAAYAFSVLQGSLSLIVDQFQALTDYTSVVNRLAAFDEACTTGRAAAVRLNRKSKSARRADRIALEKVTITTPDRTRVLQKDISFEVTRGGPAVDRRAERNRQNIADAGGRRPYGLSAAAISSGPAHEQIMFMPQKPYLLLGTLREQLQYPRTAHARRRGNPGGIGRS